MCIFLYGKCCILILKFSSLAALEVVKLTTSSAASDENFVKMTTFSFQWITRWDIDPNRQVRIGVSNQLPIYFLLHDFDYNNMGKLFPL